MIKQLLLLLILCPFSSWSAPATKSIRIIAIGDSLTEGYGLSKEKAWPRLVEKQLLKKHQVKVVNAGSSGATSASAIKLLRWQLKAKPDILILSLGANDGLRGIPVATTKANLESTIKLAKKNNLKILMTGMMLPLNYGKKYRAEYEAMYKNLAKKYQLMFMPFLLKDVATIAKLNLADGIHPNEKGYEIVAKNILVYLEKML